MKKSYRFRYRLLKNGITYNTYKTLSGAFRAMENLYYSGNVLPYDSFVILDRITMLKYYNK